jgi:Spy/CpxP family protein refolding chaperone
MYAAQQQMFRHKPCVTHWDLFQLKRDLNITDRQVTDIKIIGTQAAIDVEPITQQISDLRKVMRETLLSPEIDTVQYESQISEIIGLRSQMADILLRAKLQEAQVMTPDQRATLLEFTSQLEQCLEDEDQFPSLFPDLLK